MATQPIPLASQPGIQRDGTTLAAMAHTDGQWCRWQRGLPRKMGGYKVIQPYLTGIERAIFSQAQSGYRYQAMGNATALDTFTIDNFGITSSVANPTFPTTTHPTTAGLPSGTVNTQPPAQINSWQMDSQYDNATNQSLLFLFPNQNLLDPANGENFPLYATPIYSPNGNGTFATFTGSISGTALTTSGATGTIAIGHYLTGAGVPSGTSIISGSGSSWVLSANLGTIGAEAMSSGSIFQVNGYGTGSDSHGGTQQALFPNGISGGIVSLAPYMIVYGNNGFFAWSSPGYPTDFVGTALGDLYVGATEITNQKIIKGLPLRGGGGYSPAGIFWSVDSVIRATFIGVTNGTWQFDQLTCQSSILSDRCVVEHDGTFMWAGVDRFLQYNGVVQELPNTQNLNWFFDGINPIYASKSFAVKFPRYGEIWWCYPRGSATECSHAAIYNYREKYWYDTILPNGGRSAGLYPDNLVGPIMTGTAPYSSSVSGTTSIYYNLWEHEQGTDEVNGPNAVSVNSYYTTAAISALKSNPPQDATTSIELLEPDYLLSGNMSVTVLKQNNANAPVAQGSSVTLQPTPTGAATSATQASSALNQVVPLKDTARILRLQIQSNVLGGTYQAGQSFIHIQQDGGRKT